jgi:hypothetical protein
MSNMDPTRKPEVNSCARELLFILNKVKEVSQKNDPRSLGLYNFMWACITTDLLGLYSSRKYEA